MSVINYAWLVTATGQAPEVFREYSSAVSHSRYLSEKKFVSVDPDNWVPNVSADESTIEWVGNDYLGDRYFITLQKVRLR